MKSGKNYIGLGTGAIILNDKGEVLLIKRPNTITPDRTTSGMWSVPGGEVKFMEKVEDAVRREVREEIGVEIEIIKSIKYHDQILQESKVHWHCQSFLCKIKSGAPKILEPDKCEKLEWFDPKNLPEDCGIAHVVVPLYKLGWISKDEYERRLENTPES
ncbi:MAG: NUDIX domain-containing protein [Candidatus Aenigmarchaeota archaeon]|nr:NUDIX domain-containing protein [Candidatus Aenigmarchaeota archaeon]